MQALPLLGGLAVLLAHRVREAKRACREMDALIDEVRSRVAAALRGALLHPTSPPPPLSLALPLLQYRQLFNTPVERLHALRDALVEQLEAGLANKVRRQRRYE